MTPSPPTFGALLDDLVLSATTVLGAHRSFSASPPGPPPEPEGLVRSLDGAPPRIHWERRRVASGRERVPVSLPWSEEETFFDRFPASSPRADTLLVYHHGLGETPHALVPRLLRLSRTLRERCDVIAIKGPHHMRFRDVGTKLTRDFPSFVRCLAASAALVGEIAAQSRGRYLHRAVCGVSMGGVIALLEASHRSRYDLYVPFVAGPDLRDVVLRSSFARTIQGRWLREARRASWIEVLDLSARLRGASGSPLRPLLARSDRLFRWEAQRSAYARVPRARVTQTPGGHLSGVARIHLLARHLLSCLEAECWKAHGNGPSGLARPTPHLAASG
ncbi:MAG: hypothetical protein D6731_13665 [Planctomycetota bacterium]|nr:MAG: hypothetical protein D6731_13665 [Planctomycetota bacterium]